MDSAPHTMLPLGRQVFLRSQECATPSLNPWYELEWQNGDELTFTVGCPAKPWNPIAERSGGRWTAELWKHDVGELFLSRKTDRSRYLEINLAPHGAWWSGCFIGPREPNPEWTEQPFDPGNLPNEVSPTGWQTSLSLPLSFIRGALGIRTDEKLEGHLVGNVCFILGEGDARQHFSWADMPDDPPDFHCPERFVPLRQ